MFLYSLSEASTSETPEDSYENLRMFIHNASREGLPYESHCGTGPVVFNSNKCAYSETEFIQKGIDLLKVAGKRFVPHVSPYVRYNRNLTESEESDNTTRLDDDCYKFVSNNDKLFYRNKISSEIYIGLVGDDKVLYPAYEYANENFIRELWTYNGSLDGIILENSWPLDQSNKTHNETAQNLPYFNQNIMKAFDKTPPWNLQLINNSQLYLQNHNRYGNNFANGFSKTLNSTIPIWSSSQWMSPNLVMNRQNIDATWTNLHREIIQAALGGISGNWLWSSPTCGDTDNFNVSTQSNLCVKWYMANVFLPILKIQSRNISRDPLEFVGTLKNLIVASLRRRLSLLPYLYTTLQEGPLLRPMFFQFPKVRSIADVNTQFSVGDNLLIVPNLEPFQKFVHFWLPPGTWYELWSGLKLEGEVGQAVTMSTTEADFLSLIRGGSIVVMQKNTRETAEDTRLYSPMSLIIALECKHNRTQCLASGHIFVAGKTLIEFEATDKKLTIAIQGVNSSQFCVEYSAILSNIINEINLFGLDRELNNFDHHKRIQVEIDLCKLDINNEFQFS